MPEEFGTVNVNRAERAREIEVLREHYRKHRETLAKLIADAPTAHLANEYKRVTRDIDVALTKLDEIEGSGGSIPPAPKIDTQPGMRPLVTSPSSPPDFEPDTDSRSRVLLIVAAAVFALALIGWLIWKASSDRTKPGTVVEQTTTTTTTTSATAPPPETGTVVPIPTTIVNSIAVSPASADYGTIRKGTRATRQFEVRNNGDQPVTIQVARSTCRCLFYEYVDLIPPKGKESVTVTIDGARAKAGDLRETVKVSAKKDASVNASFDVMASIR